MMISHQQKLCDDLQGSDHIPLKDGIDASLPDMPNLDVASARKENDGVESATCANILEKSHFPVHLKQPSSQHQDKNGQVSIKSDSCLTSELPRDGLTILEQDRNATVSTSFVAMVVKNFNCLIVLFFMFWPLVRASV